MGEMTRATLQNLTAREDEDKKPFEVLFNPEKLTIQHNMTYPELKIPGLPMPILQFMRGEARILSTTFFLDNPDKIDEKSVAKALGKMRKLIQIDKHIHAPPVVGFAWGKFPMAPAAATDQESKFTGVIVEYKEDFVLFAPDGKPKRAKVTVKIKEYKSANAQYTQLDNQSPDRTKTRVVRQGDRLDLISAEEYGDTSYWRVIAEANGIDRPRNLRAGDLLEIPPL